MDTRVRFHDNYTYRQLKHLYEEDFDTYARLFSITGEESFPWEYHPEDIEEIKSNLPLTRGDRLNIHNLNELSDVLNDWEYGFLTDVSRQISLVSDDQADKVNEVLEKAIKRMRKAKRNKKAKTN